MTGPRIDDLDRALQEIRGKSAPKVDDMDAALAEIRGGGKRDFHEEYRKGLLGPRMARENANDRDQLENPLAAATGAVAKHAATVAQGIPGMERLQAGIGSLVSGNDYKTSLADLRGETEQIHPAARFAEKLVGGAGLGAVLPVGSLKTLGQAVKSGAAIGAGLGGADALLDADEMSASDRAKGTVTGAALGGVLGGATGAAAKGVSKALELNAVRKRVNAAPSLGESALKTDDAITDATKWNYGAADLEGELNGGTSPAVRKILERPVVKKYADMIRGEEDGALTDAELVQAVSRRMSEARMGHKASIKRLGYSDERNAEIRQLGRELKLLRDATASVSEKPPITMNIAGERTVVQPKITPSRETLQGPIPGADSRTIPGSLARTPAGRLRTDLSNVDDDALAAEYRRLAELNKREEALHGATQEKGYRAEYNELPSMERTGRTQRTTDQFGNKIKRQAEDLPDADGLVDPDVLAADNKIIADYNRSIVVRRARQQAMDRIATEMDRRPPAATVDDDVSFDFGENVKPKVQGPAGPAFQLRGQPDVIRPGVVIETSPMRVQTAPAEEVPALMPSFPKAVGEKARMEGEREAFNDASDAAKRIMRGTSLTGKRLVDKSPEAFSREITKMTPEQAREATKGVLGRAKEEVSIRPKGTLWQSIVGLGTPAAKLNKISPFLDALDQQAGLSPRQSLEVERILKAMGIVNAPLANQP